jgi:hypothetical protein
LTLKDAGGTPTVTLWGAPGSGPSGSGPDRALDLTGAGGMGTEFSGPNASLTSLSPVPALDQFTITGWFRPSTADLDRANLISIQNGNDRLRVVGLSGGPVGARSRLRLIMGEGDSFPKVDAVGAFESQWSTPNVWAFFAISYSGEDATFYSGSLHTPAALSNSSAAQYFQFPLGAASIWIGTTFSSTDPFQGYMDDVRFYGCALDLSQIEQVRLSAVPELRLSIALVDAASNAGCRGTAGCDLDGVGDSGVSSCILPVSLGEKCARLTREVLRRILAP